MNCGQRAGTVRRIRKRRGVDVDRRVARVEMLVPSGPFSLRHRKIWKEPDVKQGRKEALTRLVDANKRPPASRSGHTLQQGAGGAQIG